MDALTTKGYAGKRQAATLEQQRLTATGLGGSCREEAAARKLPRGALGRDALTTEGYTGKRQAATLEQQGLTVTGLGGSCREEAAARRARQGRPKRQAATLEQQGLTARAGWMLPRGSCRAAR